MANRLMQHELAGRTPGEFAPAVAGLFIKLDTTLSRSFGRQGYQALLARALTLTRATNPVLLGLDLSAGTTAWLPIVERYGQEATGHGAHALLAEIIELLNRFMGPTLAGRLLQGAWPDLLYAPDEPRDPKEAHDR
jgi:hypothetical protein